MYIGPASKCYILEQWACLQDKPQELMAQPVDWHGHPPCQWLWHSKDAHGIRHCPCVAMASWLQRPSNRLWFRPSLGKSLCQVTLLPALPVDESKQLLVSSVSAGPTQPAASPGYRTDLPDLLTVINNSPSDGSMSRGAFLQAWLTPWSSKMCFPLLFLCQGAKGAQLSALGSILQHPQLPASVQPTCNASDAAISAEPGHRAWKK